MVAGEASTPACAGFPWCLIGGVKKLLVFGILVFRWSLIVIDQRWMAHEALFEEGDASTEVLQWLADVV